MPTPTDPPSGAPARPDDRSAAPSASAAADRPPGELLIAHLSDVHFGRISDARVIDAIVADVNGSGAALVAVSGDLTQRARTREFRAARAMLDRFAAPVLVVPGNHDVRAWWHNPFDRLWRSSKRFRRLIHPDATPAHQAPGLAAFGLNSAHGWTIKGGRIRPEHVDEMTAFFARQPADAFRVLVVHHHLLLLEGLGDHDVSRGARRALDAAARADVEVVLCGHLHTSHVAPVELAPAPGAQAHRVVIASAGTATSNRGRGIDANVNFYNWIQVEPDRFTVCERRYDAAAQRFDDARQSTFERTAGGTGRDG